MAPMQQEVPLAHARELSSSMLKRSIFVDAGHHRLKVEPDGSVAYLHSTEFGKLLFGRGSVEVFKIQAGVVISQRQRERSIRLSPDAVGFSSSPQGAVQTSETLRLYGRGSSGYVRLGRYTNRSGAGLRL